jgi:hypothetical protein
MESNGTTRTLAKFEDAMKRMGVVDPIGMGAATKSQQKYNQRVANALNGTMEMILNPKYFHYWGGLSSDQIADIILPNYLQGKYNNILKNPPAFDTAGNLTAVGKKALFSKMTGTTKIAGLARDFFPDTDNAGMAYKRLTSFFGEDPVDALGVANAHRLLLSLKATADTTGISPEDRVQLMANIGTEFKKSGRSPYAALSAAKDFMLINAASREEGVKGLDAGKYNQSLMGAVAAARESDSIQEMSKIYAALQDQIGDPKAREILKKVSRDKKNIADRKRFLERAAHLSGKYLDQDLVDSYADSEAAKYFQSSGFGTLTVLRHFGNQMGDLRKQILKKNFNWTDDQARDLDKTGGASLANIHKYLLQKHNGDKLTARKELFKVKKDFDILAQKQGFANTKAADRFISGISNKDVMGRVGAGIDKAIRQYRLNRIKRPGSFLGLKQYFEGDKKQGNWLESFTGSRTLKPEEWAELNNLNYKKLDPITQKAWEKSWQTYLEPDSHSRDNRTRAKEIINKVHGGYGQRKSKGLFGKMR